MQPTSEDFSFAIFASPILIVDDNEINRLFLERSLQQNGFYNIALVENGEKALEMLPAFKPDIVLLDIIMTGGMDGYECCKEIRSRGYRDLPILMQTVISEPKMRAQAFACGATDFVSKPIYTEELCARIKVHLERLHSIRTLQIYKNRIQMELDAARKLQASILPESRDIEDLKQRCDISVASYFETCSEIGGDFWGLKSLFPNQTALWMIDFSGHGVASALNAFRLHAYLKEPSVTAARPGDYLAEMNDKLLRLLMRGQFATMFYGILDRHTNKIFYACACAPHPIILSQATGEARLIDGTGNLLGVGMNLYATQSTSFSSGDILLLYSDALTESPNDKGEYITEAQLAELLEQHRKLSPEEIKTKIVSLFKAHSGDRMHDDLTIVVCARNLQ